MKLKNVKKIIMRTKNVMREGVYMILFLKFVEPQYVESTLDGDFYFSRSGYFIDLEKKQKEEGIGDSREGSWSKHISEDSVMFIEIEDGEEINFPVESGAFFLHYEDIRKVPMCCFTLLSSENDFYKENNNWKIKHHIIDSLKEQFKGRVVLLFKPPELVKRVKKILIEKGIPLKGDRVKYYDEQQEDHPVSEQDFNTNPTKALFFKRKRFEFQKEYRIIFPGIFEEDFILNLGDVRGFSKKMDIENLKKLELEVINSSEQN